MLADASPAVEPIRDGSFTIGSAREERRGRKRRVMQGHQFLFTSPGNAGLRNQTTERAGSVQISGLGGGGGRDLADASKHCLWALTQVQKTRNVGEFRNSADGPDPKIGYIQIQFQAPQYKGMIFHKPSGEERGQGLFCLLTPKACKRSNHRASHCKGTMGMPCPMLLSAHVPSGWGRRAVDRGQDLPAPIIPRL